MARLILPRAGLSNRPIKPDRSNKFGRNVSIWTAPMLMQLGDLAGDIGGQFILPGKGVRIDATNYSDPGLEFNIKPQPNVDLEKFTMVYVYQRPEDTSDSFGHYFRFDSAGDTSVRWEQNGSIGNSQYYDLNDNGAAFNDIQPISNNTDNRRRAFIFTIDHNAGVMRIWVSNPEDSFFLFGDNGVTSEISLSGSPAGPTEVTRLHIGRDNSGSNSFIDLRVFLGMFAFIPGRYLSPTELIALGNDPWQMFQPTLELPVFTPSGAGGTVTGSGTPSLAAITASGTGNAFTTITATGAATLGAVEAAGTGERAVTASGAAQLPGISATGAGERGITASGATSLPTLTASGTGEREITSSGAVDLPSVTADGAGGIEGQINGTGDVTLGAVTASGTGEREVTSSGAATLPGVEGSGAGSVSVEITGSGAVNLPLVEINGVGVVNREITASGAATLPGLGASGTDRLRPIGGDDAFFSTSGQSRDFFYRKQVEELVEIETKVRKLKKAPPKRRKAKARQIFEPFLKETPDPSPLVREIERFEREETNYAQFRDAITRYVAEQEARERRRRQNNDAAIALLFAG